MATTVSMFFSSSLSQTPGTCARLLRGSPQHQNQGKTTTCCMFHNETKFLPTNPKLQRASPSELICNPNPKGRPSTLLASPVLAASTFHISAAGNSELQIFDSYRLRIQPQKVKTPNKPDTTCQEEFFAKQARLGHLLGETDLYQGLLFLYYTQTRQTTLHFSRTQQQS